MPGKLKLNIAGIVLVLFILSAAWHADATLAQGNDSNQGFASASVKVPQDLLDREQARAFMLGLINRDRASKGVAPVVLDEIANTAGQLHSDEMAQYGYLSHWTMDGRKPDERYTECGGKDLVAENADGSNEPHIPKAALCQKQLFSKRDLEEVEGQFFNERPPNDGHRVNILDANHTAVGIGLSVSGFEPGSEQGFPDMTCTQEFVNHYGTYSDIPRALAPGDSFVVEGTMLPGLHFDCIDLRWEKFPQAMSIEELNKTYSYGIPDEVVASYFPPPFDSPAPVILSAQNGGEHFRVEIPTNKGWKPGMYYVNVWAHRGENKNAFQISTRTLRYGESGNGTHRLERRN